MGNIGSKEVILILIVGFVVFKNLLSKSSGSIISKSKASGSRLTRRDNVYKTPPNIHVDNLNIVVAGMKPKGPGWVVKFSKRGMSGGVERYVGEGTISGNVSVDGERGNFYCNW